MKRLSILLLCCAFAFGQSAPIPPAEQNVPNRGFGLGVGTNGRPVGNVEILSDTQGVDFGPYLKHILPTIRENWLRLIPESAETKKGKLAIEFAITKDGRVADMRLVATSGDVALDRPAWASIAISSPFPPLPSEFTGPQLALRLRFSYNPDSSGPDSSGKGYPAGVDLAASRSKSKSGVTVSITAPLPGDRDVPLGGSRPVTAIVTGTGSNENAVEWSISGFGCSGGSCGAITKGSYHAPSVTPSSSFVTLTAVSKADPSAKATITLHIVGANPPR